MSQLSFPDHKPDLTALRAYALGELEHQRDSSDIIEHLCLRGGWSWEEAKQFLESVQVDNQFKLEAHQNRRYIWISLLMLIGGALNIAVFILWALYNPRTGKFVIPDNSAEAILLLVSQLSWLSFTPVAYLFYGLALTGIGMVIGGIIGLLKHSASAAFFSE